MVSCYDFPLQFTMHWLIVEIRLTPLKRNRWLTDLDGFVTLCGRGGVEIPESAKMILLQEQKFKTYNHELSFSLKEYRRVTQSVKPIATNLMRPHMENLEFKMRQG